MKTKKPEVRSQKSEEVGRAAPRAPAHWKPVTDMPDSDICVLMRLDDDEFPVLVGYHDGEHWRTDDAEFISPKLGHEVIGWMHLETAAKILDAKAGAK
jgi:hypothetical protein